MTNTISELTRAANRADLEPNCQALLQCSEQCCDPEPCGQPAVARVSFECTETDCDRASHVLLLCASCADQAAEQQVIVRRPL